MATAPAPQLSSCSFNSNYVCSSVSISASSSATGTGTQLYSNNQWSNYEQEEENDVDDDAHRRGALQTIE